MEDRMNNGGLFRPWAIGPFRDVVADASESLFLP
jgi:hypothetical protein